MSQLAHTVFWSWKSRVVLCQLQILSLFAFPFSSYIAFFKNRTKMSNICASCLVCLFVLAFLGCIGIIPYIGIETCSWLSDFEDWADEVNTIVSSDSTNCTNERKLYNLIDDIDAFITITFSIYIFIYISHLFKFNYINNLCFVSFFA